MTRDEMAKLIIESIDRNGLRGLVYETSGMEEVVIHGRVDLLAVADDILEAWEDQASRAASGCRSG